MVKAISDVLRQNEIDVVGEATNGEEALAKLEARRPDVAIVDVHMPGLSGIEVARRALHSVPSSAVILYTAYGERALLADAMDAGARGFVLKEAPLADLVRAVQLVKEGRVYVDPVLAGALVTPETAVKIPALTQRERDVLRLLSKGLSNEEIGRALFISAETVRTHVSRAMKKLEADTRTEAVATALRRSLIS